MIKNDNNISDRAKLVSLIDTKTYEYPEEPFSPARIYPEFSNFSVYSLKNSNQENKVYDGVRRLFEQLGLDKDRVSTDKWNPLKDLVYKHDNVVIKPNLVIDNHPLGDIGIEAMITHASIIRPIIDYILLATGDVNITICDVPLQAANWENLLIKSALKPLMAFYKKNGIRINLLDLRYEISVKNQDGALIQRNRKKRDPLGYQAVDLKEKSYLYGIKKDYKRLEITDYGKGTVARHHNNEKNEYLIPKTILNADVFINIPKLKTHRKAGVTLSMKNLIGINGDKSWIAHHRRGIDEYPYFNLKSYFKWYVSYYLKIYAPTFMIKLVYKLNRKFLLKGKTIKEHGMKQGGILMEGNWYGNDTVWRTILDLNNIIFFSNTDGVMQPTQQRRYLSIIDGIIGMEKEGPMEGIPKKTGTLIGGFHPIAVDYVASSIMGFDHTKIPKIREGFKKNFYGLTDFGCHDVVVADNTEWKNINLGFEATSGWKGHI